MTVAALALITALVAFPGADTPPLDGPAFLDPRTLEPVPGSAVLPEDAFDIELSPDRKLIANTRRNKNIEIRTASGRRIASFETPHRFPGPLSWMSPRRLLAFDCQGNRAVGGHCAESSVQVINPKTRKVIRTTTFEGGIDATSRIGDRMLVHLAAPEPADPSTPQAGSSVVVLDEEGRIVHEIDLPDLQFPEENLSGSILVDVRTVYGIDVRTGELTRRTFRRQVTSIQPSPPGLALLEVDSRDSIGIDPATLETKVEIPDRGLLFGGTRRGFYSAFEGKVKVFSQSGRVRRTIDTGDASEHGAVGRYLYSQELSGTPRKRRYRVRAFDTKTGRQVAVRRGQFDLLAPQRGRTNRQIPGLRGSDVFFDD